MTNEATSNQQPHADLQPHAFQADVARLLQLMVHSVYSDRDIFVRELISNGADACEKLRYSALGDAKLQAPSAFLLTIAIDKAQRKLIFSDNGIGMSAAEMALALGTIASSGTRAFLDQIGQDPGKVAAPELIGQFGIGFYSAFMVADRVDVISRRAGENEAHIWSSDGKGTYTIEPIGLDQAPAHGTKVILHLNKASDEYLESYRIEHIVREHSSSVSIPIDLISEGEAEPKRIGEGRALWVRPKSEISAQEYNDFYRTVSGQLDDPALVIHWRAEGRHEYQALAFVPGSRGMDLFDPGRRSRARLYVRRVLIDSDADLLPGYLRFVRAVVDSSDLPLNVSRELIQDTPVFAAIKKGLTNRIVQELGKVSETDSPAFQKIWENFGTVLKEGIYEDFERRDSLLKLARFATSIDASGARKLADYVANMRENQTAIYYLTGDDMKRLEASPQLEGFRSRNIEVLLLPDPVDAFWVEMAQGFDGKPFKSVSQGAADIHVIPLADGREAPAKSEADAKTASLMSFMKDLLQEEVSDVRVSDRLSSSAACLVAGEGGPDRRLERLLAQQGQILQSTKPVLELNPSHALIVKMASQLDHGEAKSFIADACWLILDEARLMEGEKLADASAFAARLMRVLEKAAG